MDNEIKVTGKLKGPNKFPFVVKVYRNGDLVSTCEGLADGGRKSKGKKATCDHISINPDDYNN